MSITIQKLSKYVFGLSLVSSLVGFQVANESSREVSSVFNYQGKMLSPLIVKLNKQILDEKLGVIRISGQVATSSFTELNCTSKWIFPENILVLSGEVESQFILNRQYAIHNFDIVVQGYDLSINENSFFKVEFSQDNGRQLGQHFTLPSREDLTLEYKEAMQVQLESQEQEQVHEQVHEQEDEVRHYQKANRKLAGQDEQFERNLKIRKKVTF